MIMKIIMFNLGSIYEPKKVLHNDFTITYVY